jgi:excinuclease UvrABC nuclease subunit
MIRDAVEVRYKETPSVLEALILEVSEIKKHKPFANVKEKDDKSYNYVLITKEDFPRIIVERGKNLESRPEKFVKTFGPFPHAGELREALKIIRKIFPYRDEKCKLTGRPCFNAQIGLCPGPCAGWIGKRDYRKIIRHISLFFEAKKDELIKDLEKEMKSLAKDQKFEEADKVKRTLYALEHIHDMALIKRDVERGDASFRIEAYDIAHISGTNVVGVMTVIEDGELSKSQYRKFKIRADKNDDTNNLKEVLRRRFNHQEWTFPNMVAVDGGQGQLNAAWEVVREIDPRIEVVSVVKNEKHKAREILGLEDKTLERQILLANADAHRFAINYHRKLRSKGFRI